MGAILVLPLSRLLFKSQPVAIDPPVAPRSSIKNAILLEFHARILVQIRKVNTTAIASNPTRLIPQRDAEESGTMESIHSTAIVNVMKIDAERSEVA